MVVGSIPAIDNFLQLTSKLISNESTGIRWTLSNGFQWILVDRVQWIPADSGGQSPMDSGGLSKTHVQWRFCWTLPDLSSGKI